MVRWNELTTKKGGSIVFVFEDEKETKSIINKQYTHRKLQKKCREKIQFLGIDSGSGSTVYVLMNSEGVGRYLDKSAYEAWEKQEKKDWFHRKMPSILGEIMEKMMIASVLSEIFGGDIDLDLDDSDCSGPTEEEMKEIKAIGISDEEREKIAKDGNCQICQAKSCLLRKASFDMSLFREEFKK